MTDLAAPDESRVKLKLGGNSFSGGGSSSTSPPPNNNNNNNNNGTTSGTTSSNNNNSGGGGAQQQQQLQEDGSRQQQQQVENGDQAKRQQQVEWWFCRNVFIFPLLYASFIAVLPPPSPLSWMVLFSSPFFLAPLLLLPFVVARKDEGGLGGAAMPRC